MNVLSLFDGMSCGHQALDRAGIEVSKYFASEIDKYAIKVTMSNYPETVQLGSVVDVNGYELPKIDLLIGGSPCQSFSFAGRRKGMSTKDEQEILTLEHYLQLKSEGYEFEGESYLFWEYMRLLNEVKPKYFLLENVVMGEKWEKILSKAIGVHPIEINSALVSAQNRRRLYWTNIGMKPSGLFGFPESIIQQPKDKKILLKDILQDNPNAKYYVSDKMMNKINRYKNAKLCSTLNDKSMCIASGYYKQGRDNQYIPVDEKYFISQKGIDYINRNERNIAFQMHEDDLKSGCVVANYKAGIPYNQIIVSNRLRRLTPLECERLQTIPDNYTNYVSDSQRYKMIGNGWTIDVIAHILSYIEESVNS